MPRRSRHLPLWVPVHVVNRGVDKRRLFLQPDDFERFIDLLVEAVSRFPVDIFGYNVMLTHFHLLLRQRSEGAISAALRRVTGGSACHYRRATSSVGLGHVYQRRFWSKVITDEQQYLTGLRYVEDNARHGGLVKRAEEWKWGSLWERLTGGRSILAPSLVPLPGNWMDLVNQTLPEAEREVFRSPTRTRRVFPEAAPGASEAPPRVTLQPTETRQPSEAREQGMP